MLNKILKTKWKINYKIKYSRKWKSSGSNNFSTPTRACLLKSLLVSFIRKENHFKHPLKNQSVTKIKQIIKALLISNPQ